MAELLRAAVLSDEEKSTVNRLAGKVRLDRRGLDRLDTYFGGEQRLMHIGLALPEEVRIFETIVNIPRLAVQEPVLRQRLKAFYRAGDSTRLDEDLRLSWEANNLPSESALCHTDARVYGRSFVAVGTNPDGADRPPLITVESPKEIACEVDRRRRKMSAAFRQYRDTDLKVTRGTLYQPDATVHLVRGQRGWEVVDRDDHHLGVVPLVMFLNARRAGQFDGRSEMADVITKTDGIARLITNLLVGAETHAMPARWIAGATQEDFVDEDGNPIPVWESYLTAIRAIKNSDARFGQWEAGDLKNFTGTVDSMLAWCATELGLPTRYVGQSTVNPAAEGAIRADESRLIVRTMDKNRFDGDSWAWVMGLEERLRTGKWGAPNSIRTLWHDPGTATTAEAADAALKLRSQGALSVEGMWDMLDWDEARKKLERERLDAEAGNAVAHILRDASQGAMADAADSAALGG